MKKLYNTLFASHYENASGIYSIHPAAADKGLPSDPAQIETYRIQKNGPGNTVLGHLYRLTNPVGRFTVQEPKNSASSGCSTRTLSRTSDTSTYRQCRVATNAGFFDPHDGPTKGECIGNLVVSGVPVRAPGTQNANFGLLKNGSFVVGYIPMEMISRPDPENPGQTISDFDSLVAGVVMLVKDSTNFVSISRELEDPSSQTTGSLPVFIEVITARTALGHDKNGNLLLFVSDGRGNTDRGIDLVSLADLLLLFGAVNAINLDGGGSSTAVQNNQVVNMPTDGCPGLPNFVTCERAVSSIICLQDGPAPAPVVPPVEPVTSLPPQATATPVFIPEPAFIATPEVVVAPIDVTTPSASTPQAGAPSISVTPQAPMAEAPVQSPHNAPKASEEPHARVPQETPIHTPEFLTPLSGGWKAVIVLSVTAAAVSLTVLFVYIYLNYRNQISSVPYEALETGKRFGGAAETDDESRW
jgi:exopolysaccharide biosynthesis protein